jgi:hypothetical protein
MPPPRQPLTSAIAGLRFSAAMLCALGAAACSHGRESVPQPPNARGIIIASRGQLWRNLDTIRNASIAEPRLQGGIWHVCVRMKVQGPLGNRPDERDFLVALHAAGPELLMTDAAAACATQPHTPFPELEGGYQTDHLLKRGGGRK